MFSILVVCCPARAEFYCSVMAGIMNNSRGHTLNAQSYQFVYLHPSNLRGEAVRTEDNCFVKVFVYALI